MALTLSLLLCGCHQEDKPEETRPLDTEFTASYNWTAGESPVPEKRIGLKRFGVNNAASAVGPNGIYFLENRYTAEAYISYADNGSDQIIRLCGRADCTHNSTDCNASFPQAMDITFYRGYLYVMCGMDSSDECKLIRMEPDGSNHVTMLDVTKFAKEHGGDFATCDIMTDGYFLFKVNKWTQSGSENSLTGSVLEYYYYALDGSMEEPQVQNNFWILYNCGDVIVDRILSEEGYGSVSEWDPVTNTSTHLTDHPGYTAYFGRESAYYLKDGVFCQLDYATQKETALFDTGLEGTYKAYPYPDCIVIANSDSALDTGGSLYIFNWAYELVEEVKLTFSHAGMSADETIIGETAERFILSDQGYENIPKYYIEKSELGTGNAVVHEFQRN